MLDLKSKQDYISEIERNDAEFAEVLGKIWDWMDERREAVEADYTVSAKNMEIIVDEWLGFEQDHWNIDGFATDDLKALEAMSSCEVLPISVEFDLLTAKKPDAKPTKVFFAHLRSEEGEEIFSAVTKKFFNRNGFIDDGWYGEQRPLGAAIVSCPKIRYSYTDCVYVLDGSGDISPIVEHIESKGFKLKEKAELAEALCEEFGFEPWEDSSS